MKVKKKQVLLKSNISGFVSFKIEPLLKTKVFKFAFQQNLHDQVYIRILYVGSSFFAINQQIVETAKSMQPNINHSAIVL